MFHHETPFGCFARQLDLLSCLLAADFQPVTCRWVHRHRISSFPASMTVFTHSKILPAPESWWCLYL